MYKIMPDPVDSSVTGLTAGGSDSGHLAVVFRGVDPSAPIDATTTTSSSGSGDPNPAAITTATNGAMVVGLAFLDDDLISTPTAPSGYTLADFNTFGVSGTGGSVMAVYKEVATAGSEDPGTIVTNGDDVWWAATVALRPKIVPKYAVFFSSLITNNNTADKTYVRITDGTNTLYQASIEPRDTTDLFSATGVAIFEPTAATSTTITLQYYTDSGGTASIQDAYLTALELVDTDIFNYDTSSFSFVSTTDDGDDVYDTINDLTLSAGSYFIIGSAAFQNNGGETRIHIWDDTNDAAYGAMRGGYYRENTQYQPYWYVMGVSPASTTNYDLRAKAEYNASGTISYRTILALDRTINRQAYSEHAENVQTSTSLSDTVADSITVSLSNSGNNLVLASWWGAYEDTATSWFSNIQLNGTDIYSSDIAVEPSIGGGNSPTFGDGSSSWCCGFAGVQNMSSGSNTVRVVWRTENAADTASIGRVNVSGFDLDSGLGFNWYVKSGGSWKQSDSFNVKVGGVWKEATGLYVKSGGAWKSLLNEHAFTGNNVDAASSEYTSNFPNPPPPPVTCFLAGSLILMANGKLKPIEEVRIGEYVMGRWGPNRVIAYDRPLLGNRYMWNINDEVFNTPEHLTWTQKGWAVISKEGYISHDYRAEISVIVDHETGAEEVKTYLGVNPESVGQFEIGDYIAHESGFKKIHKLEPVRYPEDTQLYALVTDGNHTIHVNGYVFSGWANDTDYDYDSKIGT
jgi:hypothetical protein